MNNKLIDDYLRMLSVLTKIRNRTGNDDDEEVESHLSKMDFMWYQMSPEEIDKINKMSDEEIDEVNKQLAETNK